MGVAMAVADFASYRRPEARVIFVTNTSFFSDGSIFAHSPSPELRGRVFGATTSLAYVAMPIGMLVFGVALERLGLTTVLFASAALYGVVWVLMALSRPLRQFGGPGAPGAVTG